VICFKPADDARLTGASIYRRALPVVEFSNSNKSWSGKTCVCVVDVIDSKTSGSLVLLFCPLTALCWSSMRIFCFPQSVANSIHEVKKWKFASLIGHSWDPCRDIDADNGPGSDTEHLYIKSLQDATRCLDSMIFQFFCNNSFLSPIAPVRHLPWPSLYTWPGNFLRNPGAPSPQVDLEALQTEPWNKKS
jgi:hypothetical protein